MSWIQKQEKVRENSYGCDSVDCGLLSGLVKFLSLEGE